MPVTETITWNVLPDDGMPDAEITVQLTIERADDADEVWPGWWDGEQWIDAASACRVAGRVVSWSDMPAGSRGC